MIVQILSIIVIGFTIKDIIPVAAYGTFYLEDYLQSNETLIKLENKNESAVVLRCSRQKRDQSKAPPDSNSSVILSVSENDGILVNVQNIKFEKPCDSGEKIKIESNSKYFVMCDPDSNPWMETGSMMFREQNVTVVYSSKQNLTTYCDITVTAFRDSPCGTGDFRCASGICIWNGLLCDHRNNCGDRSDELDRSCRMIEQTSFAPLYLTISFFFMASLFLMCCCIRRFRMSPRYNQTEVLYLYNAGGGWGLEHGRPILQAGPYIQRNDTESSRNSESYYDPNEPSTSNQSSNNDSLRRTTDSNEAYSKSKGTSTSKQNSEEYLSKDSTHSTGSSHKNIEPPNSNETTDDKDSLKKIKHKSRSSIETNKPLTSGQDIEKDSSSEDKSFSGSSHDTNEVSTSDKVSEEGSSKESKDRTRKPDKSKEPSTSKSNTTNKNSNKND